MTHAPSQNPLIEVKSQPNVYTVLLIVAVVALGVTIAMVLYNLLAAGGYGMSFGQVFTGEMPGA